MRRIALLTAATACVALVPARGGGVVAAADAAQARTGLLGPVGAVSLDGLLHGAADGTVQGTVPAAAGRQFLTGSVRGSDGRVVQVSLNGVLSAPITLSGAAQRFGVTAPHPDSGLDVIHVVPAGAWSSGDSVQASGLTLGTSAPNVTTVQSGTREMLLNGSPFIAKGFDYSNSPIGTPAPFGFDGWADHPELCQSDAVLLGGAGANLIRLFQNVTDAAPAQLETQCLDAFAANGVGVEFDLFPAGGDPSDPDFTTVFSAQIAQQIAAWKDHPATLLWEVDNEVEQNGNATATADWYGSASQPGELDTMARAARADDSNHLVGTGISTAGTTGCLGWMGAANAPALQFWGLHIYNTHPATSSCTRSGTTLSMEAQAASATSLPIIVDEFGVGRYSCSPGASGAWLQWLSPVNVSFTPAYACTVPGSAEDQAGQATFLSNAWNDMAPYLASSSNPQGPYSGGLAWEYSDQWWNTEASVFAPLPATPWTHETDGVKSCCGALPGGSGWTAPEWFSVNDATTPGDNGIRVSTLGFDALEAAWLGTTLPSLTGVSTSLSAACPTVTVTWTTSAAMTTQLDVGPRVIDAAEGQTLSDSTYYMQAANDATLATTHSVTLSGLVPGQDYQVAVRSFTSAGASVTTTPVDVTWMPTLPPGLPLSCPAPNMPPFPQLP